MKRYKWYFRYGDGEAITWMRDMEISMSYVNVHKLSLKLHKCLTHSFANWTHMRP